VGLVQLESNLFKNLKVLYNYLYNKMAALGLVTGWAVGAINGYKEGDLPNSVKYGTMGLTTGAGIARIITNQGIKPVTPGIFLAAILLGAPFVSGYVFCLGHHLGKAVGYYNESESNKNKVSIKLL
jgi:hypothetical protein